ncbi:MAG TPA: hypothetical protein VK177_15835 [Flavobacteriales bacterium]|nr:hypothetical protein [Flavobacteriales bacterium]
MNKNIFLYVLLFLVFSANGFAQGATGSIRLEVKTSDYFTGAKIKIPITVTVLNYHAVNYVYKTDSVGKAPKIMLDYNGLYEIRFEASGMLKRSVVIDTRNYPADDRYAKGMDMPVEMSMIALQKMENCGNRINEMEKMITSTASYNAHTASMDWDIGQVAAMKKALKECIEE